jgi:hypothetical protein
MFYSTQTTKEQIAFAYSVITSKYSKMKNSKYRFFLNNTILREKTTERLIVDPPIDRNTVIICVQVLQTYQM